MFNITQKARREGARAMEGIYREMYKQAWERYKEAFNSSSVSNAPVFPKFDPDRWGVGECTIRNLPTSGLYARFLDFSKEIKEMSENEMLATLGMKGVIAVLNEAIETQRIKVVSAIGSEEAITDAHREFKALEELLVQAVKIADKIRMLTRDKK